MKIRPADIFTEPSRQKFGTISKVHFVFRWGSWLLDKRGLFRWCRMDFTAGGKPTARHDWRRVSSLKELLHLLRGGDAP